MFEHEPALASPGVRVDRFYDACAGSEPLDDDVPAPIVNDRLDLGEDVIGRHEEVRRIPADRLVFAARELEVGTAVRPRALVEDAVRTGYTACSPAMCSICSLTARNSA